MAHPKGINNCDLELTCFKPRWELNFTDGGKITHLNIIQMK